MLENKNIDEYRKTNEKVIKLDTNFGTDVREVRSALGMRMDAFAEQVKLSTAELEKLEAGDTRGSLLVCERLQRFLKMTLAAHMAEKMKRLKKEDKMKLNRRTLLHLLSRVEERCHKRH